MTARALCRSRHLDTSGWGLQHLISTYRSRLALPQELAVNGRGAPSSHLTRRRAPSCCRWRSCSCAATGGARRPTRRAPACAWTSSSQASRRRAPAAMKPPTTVVVLRQRAAAVEQGGAPQKLVSDALQVKVEGQWKASGRPVEGQWGPGFARCGASVEGYPRTHSPQHGRHPHLPFAWK